MKHAKKPPEKGGIGRLAVILGILAIVVLLIVWVSPGERLTIRVAHEGSEPLFDLTVLDGSTTVRTGPWPAGKVFEYTIEKPSDARRLVRFRQHQTDDPENVEVVVPPGGFGPQVGFFSVRITSGGIKTDFSRSSALLPAAR